MPFPSPAASETTVSFRVARQVFALTVRALPGARWEAITTTIDDTDEQWIACLTESVTRWTVHPADEEPLEWVTEFTDADARTLWGEFPQFVRIELRDQIQALNLSGGDPGKAASGMNEAVDRLIAALNSSPRPATRTGSG